MLRYIPVLFPELFLELVCGASAQASAHATALCLKGDFTDIPHSAIRRGAEVVAAVDHARALEIKDSRHFLTSRLNRAADGSEDDPEDDPCLSSTLASSDHDTLN
jgi:hypothetical protein